MYYNTSRHFLSLLVRGWFVILIGWKLHNQKSFWLILNCHYFMFCLNKKSESWCNFILLWQKYFQYLVPFVSFLICTNKQVDKLNSKKWPYLNLSIVSWSNDHNSSTWTPVQPKRWFLLDQNILERYADMVFHQQIMKGM